ncbi:MAG: nucleotide exchange factor GrpE [Defluviitaleaceae bacterium]|nr:nucleotide exchange factor GrpE [Defluviitaleaceae bacterium]
MSNLFSAWQEYKAVSSKSLGQSIKEKFSAIREAVRAQIAADAARFSRLGESDETVYAHLVGLMGVYRRVVDLAADSSFESPTVRALIMGICEVLKSRLREFEEETGDFQEGSNPITLEKCAIVDEAVLKAVEVIEKHESKFATGLRNENEVWDDSFEMILLGNFYDFYTTYREALRFCQAKFDDLQGRKTSRFYTALVEREWEELGNIIKVQVLALEEAAPREPTVTCILDALREAYQQTAPIIEELQKLLASSPRTTVCRPLEEFESELNAALVAASPVQPEKQMFLDALDAQATVLLGGFDMEYKKAAYTLQRMVSAEVLLAEEITDVFVKSLASIKNNNQAEVESEKNILTGICETIEIKISGLKENIVTFTSQCGDVLKEFSTEKTAFGSEEMQPILENVRAAWTENPPEDESAIGGFFEECKNGRTFDPCRELLENKKIKYTEKLEKASLRFKREVLLYEVCTFEEILTHSVSRLRDSQDRHVLAAAQDLDFTFRSLEVILKKNNITVIRPLLKEQFNSKEHEVIIAEKHSNFEKGEIVKVMTAGYKHKEQVILRANVIAAR